MSLKKYKEKIENAAKNNSSELLWNDGVEHNAIIMTEIFKYSQHIRMFCGIGSIFQEDFRIKVNNIIHERYNNEYNPMDALYKEIISFLLRKGELEIILEKEDSLKVNADTDLKIIFDKCREQIKIHKLDNNLKPQFHFSVGDNNRYRREIGADKHNAYASYNDYEKVEMLQEQFNLLLLSSKKTKFVIC